MSNRPPLVVAKIRRQQRGDKCYRHKSVLLQSGGRKNYQSPIINNNNIYTIKHGVYSTAFYVL